MEKILDNLWSKLDKTCRKKFDKENLLRDLKNHFVNKEKLYRYRTDKEYFKGKYKKEIEKSIDVASRVLDNTFLFRNKWDMEKTNVPYTFEGKVKWDTVVSDDLEWCYMFNRHKYFVHLGRAYYYTGNSRYLEKFQELITSFIEEEHDRCLTWRSIEAGLRVENWIRALEYFIEDIDAEVFVKILHSLYEHGTYIGSKRNFFTETSNWGVLEYHGLFNLGIYGDIFEESKDWIKESIDVMECCVENQVLEDGSQWEQSPMYHNEVLKLLLNVLYHYEKNGIVLSMDFIESIEKMVEANLKWIKPNGNQPLMGDSDDVDIRDIMTYAALIFGREEYKVEGYKELNYELALMHSEEHERWYIALEGEKTNDQSHYMKNLGLLVSRGRETYVNFYLKSLGGGHSHDDILHLSYFRNGKDYLVDSGRYTYVDNKWRSYFKSALKHNSFLVDGHSMNDYKDSWSNTFESQVFGSRVELGENIDYAEGSTLAFMKLADPVVAKRKVIHIKEEGIVLVIDHFRGRKVHEYQLNFNLAPMRVSVEDDRAIADDIRIENLDNMDMGIIDTYHSPEYNLKVKSKRIVYRKLGGEEVFTTCIFDEKVRKIKYLEVTDRLGNKVEKNIALALDIHLNGYKYRIFVREDMQKGTSFFKVEDKFYIKDYSIEKVEEDGTTDIN